MRFLGIVSALAVTSGCSGSSHPRSPADEPSVQTDCYAGTSSGMGQTANTLARRVVDPTAKSITEDVIHDDAGPGGAKSFHVVMTVEGNHFTMREAAGAFAGEGTLEGQPWQWKAWQSIAKLPDASITVESHDELTTYGLKATKVIKRDGKQVATTVDELRAFECEQWDDAKAALLRPVADKPHCEHACRQYATLKFWGHAQPEIDALPEADRAAARAVKDEELQTKLAAGMDACVSQCLDANNPKLTACWGAATTVDQLAACDSSD